MLASFAFHRKTEQSRTKDIRNTVRVQYYLFSPSLDTVHHTVAVTEIIAHLRHLQSVSKPEGSIFGTGTEMALTVKPKPTDDIRITRSIFRYSGQSRCNSSDFSCNQWLFGPPSAKEQSQKSLTQKIKDVSILPVRSRKKMFTRSHCDRISVPGLRVMDHHGNRPGAVAASQLEADNTVGVMLVRSRQKET